LRGLKGLSVHEPDLPCREKNESQVEEPICHINSRMQVVVVVVVELSRNSYT
jgi:hypothetical protein